MAEDRKKTPMKSVGIDPEIAAKHAGGGIDPANVVRINDVEYDFTKLPEEARKLLLQMRVADQEISRLQATMAILHDARQGYGARLAELLPQNK